MPTLNELRDRAHKNAIEHGFYDEEHIPHSEAVLHAFTAQKIALIHSELSEALEADRKDNYAMHETFQSILEKGENDFGRAFDNCIKNTFEDEIADAIIRLLDLCGALGIDIDNHVQMKMEYNESRPIKNGKKY